MSIAELPPHEPEFERAPPHDMAAEQCVLGGMLLSQDAIAESASRNNGSATSAPNAGTASRRISPSCGSRLSSLTDPHDINR